MYERGAALIPLTRTKSVRDSLFGKGAAIAGAQLAKRRPAQAEHLVENAPAFKGLGNVRIVHITLSMSALSARPV
jgi:hypothetical protein